jgi:low affinity Fe/Cu permease
LSAASRSHLDDDPRPSASDESVEHRRRLLRRAAEESNDGTWRRGMFRGSSVRSVHATAWEQRHWTSRLLYAVGEVVAHSGAGIVAALLVLGWAIVGAISGFPAWWQTVLYSVTGSVTFVMVFVIQHTQQRQTAATQRKLDELLRASERADSALIAVEEAPDEHLEALARLNLADRERAVEYAPIEQE